MLVLRSFQHEALGQFFLVACGCQVATIIAAAKTITPLIMEQPAAVRRVRMRRIVSGEASILALAATLITFLMPRSTQSGLLEWSVYLVALLCYASSNLEFDWWRRVGAVLRSNDPTITILMPQILRCTGIGIGFAAYRQLAASPTLILFTLAAFQLISAAISRNIARSQIDGRVEARELNSSPPIKSAYQWTAIASEAIASLSWANIPIFLLAHMSGSLLVAQLVAVRTPLSFFNPLIEYVEVHTRRRIGSKYFNYRWSLFAGIPTVWVTMSSLLYWKGDAIVSTFSAGEYNGLRTELTLFWWLQLAALIDRLTHNAERLRHPLNNNLMGTLILSAGMTLITGLGIAVYGVVGCIAAMALWCLVNVVVRLRATRI